jgi:hypothetical protein
MKNSIFTLTLSVLALASCTNPIEQMTDKAITEVKSGLLDPKSFELISTEVDTLRASWQIVNKAESNLKYVDLYLEQAQNYQKKVDWEISWGTSSMGYHYLGLAKQYADSAVKYNKQYEKEVARAKTLIDTPNDSIIGYTVDVRYYAINRGGDKTMGENRYFVFNNGKTDLEDISPLAKL